MKREWANCSFEVISSIQCEHVLIQTALEVI